MFSYSVYVVTVIFLFVNRKLELDISENDSDLRTSEERPFSNRSSSEFSFQGNKFLKKKVNIKEPEPVEQISGRSIRSSSAENRRRVADSEEDEMLQLVGSSVEFSENEDKRFKMPVSLNSGVFA